MQPSSHFLKNGSTANTIGAWTVPEYANRYRVCRATVYNWLSAGWLQSSKIGGVRRILPEHDKAFRDRFSGAKAREL